MNANQLEQEILMGMTNFPKNIDSLLKKVPQNVFSQEGREVLKQLLELNAKDVLSDSSLFASLSEEFKSGEYFKSMLLAEANPNYLALSELLLKQYSLKVQAKIASELYQASQMGTLLDLSLLSSKLEINTKEVRNLKSWSEYYATLPEVHLFKTEIPFIDNCFGGGLALGQLMLIFGEPEAGKTMFSLQILENISFKTKVCFFCFEFTVNDYLKRRANSSFVKAENFLIINDGYELEEITRNIINLSKEGVKFFLIDSQMRVQNNKGRNNEEEESQKFSALAKICHSLNLFILFICQNSKTDKDNPLGSKKGGHEASIIIHIERVKPEKDDLEQRNQEYDDKARLFKVKKNKQNGKHYKDKICFDKEQLRFYEAHERTECEIVYEYELEEVQKTISAPLI